MSLQLFAQQPLYIVNGVVREDISSIPQEQIESIEMLDVNDQVISEYGLGASNGVSIITLKYDRRAQFIASSSINQYIADNIEWDDTDPVARFVMRYTILPSGEMVLGEILESTERRFRRKILKILESAPVWSPATNMGEAVAMEGVLRLQLPKGREMPRERYIIIR